MKKLLAFILVLSLALSLVGCASASEKAVKEAEALLASGDYDGAIAALSEIPEYAALTDTLIKAASQKADALAQAGSYDEALALLASLGGYQQVADKIADVEELLQLANVGFLLGTWKNISGDEIFTFEANGTGTLLNGEASEITYTYSDGVITIQAPLSLTLEVTEVDGIVHLIERNDASLTPNMDLVPEANYEALAPQTVEITLDNWDTYFELRETFEEYTDEFGELVFRTPSYGMFLKEEYCGLLLSNGADVTFEVTYDETVYKVTDYAGDFTMGLLTDDYTLTPANVYWVNAEAGKSVTNTIRDWRGRQDGLARDNTVSTVFSVTALSWSDTESYLTSATNVQVSRVQGTLTLLQK